MIDARTVADLSAALPVQLELPFDNPESKETDSLPDRVGERTRELVERARARWPDVEIPDVWVEFRLTGHSAGEACFDTNRTNYNFYLLEKHEDEFIDRIVPHEVAHLVAHHVYRGGHRPHGPEWKSVMRFFGADPSVTHDFDSKPARRVRRFAYGCRCADSHYLTRRSHEGVRRGRYEYNCLQCGERLAFQGAVDD